MLKTSLACACIAIASLAASGGVLAAPRGVYVEVAPPPLRTEMVPGPRRGHVWVPGYWEWRGHRHVWVNGRWMKERHGYRYNPPTWVQEGNRWVWRPGVWVR